MCSVSRTVTGHFTGRVLRDTPPRADADAPGERVSHMPFSAYGTALDSLQEDRQCSSHAEAKAGSKRTRFTVRVREMCR